MEQEEENKLLSPQPHNEDDLQHDKPPAINPIWKSEVANALSSGQLKLYEDLLSKGHRLEKTEDFEEIISLVESNDVRKEIRLIHRIYVKDPIPPHLQIIFKRRKLCHTSNDNRRGQYHKAMVKAFEDLNEIPFIQPLLKVVAYSEASEIIFDFEMDSVVHMDPVQGNTCRALIIPLEGCIYIGAKWFLRHETKHKALGNLAHELCHYSMILIYNNGAKPYFPGDYTKEVEMKKIIQLCKENNHFPRSGWIPALRNFFGCKNEDVGEKIISRVFGLYGTGSEIYEIIVRVPHMLAFYKNNENVLNTRKKVFKDLFKFYELTTLPDLMRSLPLMEARYAIKEFEISSGLADFKIFSKESLNIDFDTKNRILNISSTCPRLTMVAIFKELQPEGLWAWKDIFVKLEILEDGKKLDLLGKAFKISTEPLIVIDCEGQDHEKISEIAQKLHDREINERLIFV